MKAYIIKFPSGQFDNKIYTKISYVKRRVKSFSYYDILYNGASIIELDSSSGKKILTVKIETINENNKFKINQVSYIEPEENENESEIIEDLSNI